ncbi:MAG: type IV toxin-antitoxin system AbiEi family antitoxin domain-containing protein, partial [Pseudonocardiaceae bacterium]
MLLAGVLDERVSIAGLPDALLSRGRHHFTTEDAAAAAGITLDGVRPALARLIKKRLVFSPARGLYIAIPPEYRSWGVVPATSFVDTLMAHLDRSYYVGYLSAAEAHGAAHQKPQVFQVVVDRDLRDRDIGRVRLRFITNRGVAHLPMVRRNTRTGTMGLSTPELTAVDLANRPLRGAGLDNVATVLIEL